MSAYNIIFTGPAGVGKSTAIASISEIEPFQTDKLVSHETNRLKTTALMDYGLMKLDGGEQVHLYGMLGRECFDSVGDILHEGGIGLILLLNNTNPAPMEDLEYYLGTFGTFIDETGLAIGVTRMTDSRKPSLDNYAEILSQHKLVCPVFEVDARNADDVIMLTNSLLYLINPLCSRHDFVVTKFQH